MSLFHQELSQQNDALRGKQAELSAHAAAAADAEAARLSEIAQLQRALAERDAELQAAQAAAKALRDAIQVPCRALP